MPLPAGPEYIVLDHVRDPTMFSHDESLEIENPWAKKFHEEPTLEFKVNDSINEHRSLILVIPQKPCSFNTPPELGTLCALSTHEVYNHLKALSCKTFRRMVVDAFVYHKHCKFRGCAITLTLQLKHN